ncbi:MAG: hypothetical protein U9M90_01060 [Patescibacteria group bacterium]|nr:hypothetical protein [Patescibacteria group bacterium]
MKKKEEDIMQSMRSFVSFVTFVTIFFVTFLFFGCAPLTKEQKAELEFRSMIISVLESESEAGRIKLHRVQAKNPTDWSGKIIAEAIKEGYINVVPFPEKLYGLPTTNREKKRWIPREGGSSVPSFTKGMYIYPLIVKEVHFRITNNPTPGMSYVEYEFEGELNEFGKFLEKKGVKLLQKGVGMCIIERDGAGGWRIS